MHACINFCVPYHFTYLSLSLDLYVQQVSWNSGTPGELGPATGGTGLQAAAQGDPS